jgi:hypothetical protein
MSRFSKLSEVRMQEAFTAIMKSHHHFMRLERWPSQLDYDAVEGFSCHVTFLSGLMQAWRLAPAFTALKVAAVRQFNSKIG